MTDRAAIITGGSRGIGLAIARVLGEEGYALTLAARTPETLEQAAAELREAGSDVTTLAVNMADEEAPGAIVAHHRKAYGRLDVLVNNAGAGIGAGAADHQTKHLDLMWDVNVRAVVLFYREAAGLLKEAGAQHRSALVVNLSSMAGKAGQPWLSVYSATKSAVISYTESMNKELAEHGVKSVALCPGFVDTDMAAFVKSQLGDSLILPEDIAEAVRFLLRLSPACIVPEVMFQRPGDMKLPG